MDSSSSETASISTRSLFLLPLLTFVWFLDNGYYVVEIAAPSGFPQILELTFFFYAILCRSCDH